MEATLNYPGNHKNLASSDPSKIVREGGQGVTVEDLAAELAVYLGNAVNVLAVLNSTSDDAALAASMGKLLQDQITAINAILASDDTTLDELQEIVSYIKQNKTELQNLAIANIAGLVDALANALKLTGEASQTVAGKVIAGDLETSSGLTWRGDITLRAYLSGTTIVFRDITNGNNVYTISPTTLDLNRDLRVNNNKIIGQKFVNALNEWHAAATYDQNEFVIYEGQVFQARTGNTNQNPFTSSYDDAGTLRSTWINLSILEGKWFDYYNPATDSFSNYPLGISRLVAEYPLSRKRYWTFEITANGTFSNGGFTQTVETGDVIVWDSSRQQWGYPTIFYGKTDLKGTVSGTVNMDWLKYTAYTMDLADNTTLADVHLPAAGRNAVRTIYINAGVAEKTLNVPAYWSKDINSADFDSSVDNRIVVECISGGTSDQIVRYNISNLT